MPSPTPALRAELRARVASAEAFLLREQDQDGTWRDFDLAPGSSEAWTTACVAFALAQPPVSGEALPALRRAADALHTLRRGAGWGYNRNAATDADSTAWAVRFLTHVDDLRGLNAGRLLLGFMDGQHGPRTFRGEPFGRWAGVHADVAPMVGLALQAAGATGAAARVRDVCLGLRRKAGAPWRSFWWTSDSYAVARNLELLALGAGVPAAIAACVEEWLRQGRPMNGAFELSQLVACAVHISDVEAWPLAGVLMRSQLGGGGWTTVPCLRIPKQRSDDAPGQLGKGGDLFVTAMATLALKNLGREL